MKIKLITTTNYKKGRGNFHDCFPRITLFDYKINIFVVRFGDGGGGGQEKLFLYTCENVYNCEQPLTF